MKAIQNLRISPSDLPLGSKSAPPFGTTNIHYMNSTSVTFALNCKISKSVTADHLQPVKAFLKVCSKAKNLRTEEIHRRVESSASLTGA